MDIGDTMDITKLSRDEILKKLNTSVQGLNSDEALKRLKKYGPNSFYLTNQFLKTCLIQIFNPITLIILITLVFQLLINNYTNAIIFSILLFINIIFNIILDYKNTYPIILEKLFFGKVLVLRDGKKTKIKPQNLTIGDIVIIEKNKTIKADIKIIVENNIIIKSPLNNNYNEQNDILLAGDYILEGSGMGVVLNIGKNTEIYQISKKGYIKRTQRLPFKQKRNKINLKITLFTIISFFLLTLVLYLKNNNYVEIIEKISILIISLLPIYLLIILVLIIYKERKTIKNICFNSLNSIPSMGNITTIICNKDFLTINELTAKIIELEDGSIYEIEGAGYNDIGGFIPINPSAKYKDSLYHLNLIGKLISIGNKAKLSYENNKWITYGNEFDIASLVLNKKINNCTFEQEIVQEITTDNYNIIFYKDENTTKVCVKGKLSEVLKFCNTNSEELLERYESLKTSGYQVMAILEGNIPKSKNKKKINEKDVKNLNFIGFIGFINPLKQSSVNAIKMGQKEGIKVIITTDEDINNSEILGKQLNLVGKKTEIVTKEDIAHNFSLGKRIFDDFIKEIKILSNVDSDNLNKVILSLKQQGEIIGVIEDNIENVNNLKTAHLSISNNTSSIKNTSDLIIDNNFDDLIETTKIGKEISTIINNTLRYLLYYKITEFLILFTSLIFDIGISLSIANVILLNLSSLILAISLYLLNKNNKITEDSKTKKWILYSIINFILVLLFAIVMNAINLKHIDIKYSIIFLIIMSQIIMLFYYQDYKNSILKFKESWKIGILSIIYLIIIILIFIFIVKMNIINLLITLGYSTLILSLIEIIKKLKEQ